MGAGRIRDRGRLAAFGACWLVLLAGCAIGAAPKRVLVIHSFGNAAPPFTTHSTAFEKELTDKLGKTVDLDEVSLDVARYATLDMEEALVELMRARQAKWQPDLVVPIGSPSGVFVARYRDRLFPATTPIIYAGMDQRRLPGGALDRNATFVGESFDVPGWIDDILRIAPETRNVAVVIGDSPLEHYWTEALREEFQRFEGRVTFTWLNDLSVDGMLQRTRTLPPHSFIFFVLMMRDASGVTHNGDEVLQQIHAVANAPINGIFQHQLGLGIVGGRLYQAELEGVEAARLAVRILGGEPASNFPPRIIGSLAPRYDWRELQRWKIDEQALPAGSTVLFRTPTFWQEHRTLVATAVSVCVAQGLLIFGLLANLLRRRRAERSLRQSEARVTLAAEAARLGVWELNAATGEVWVSDKTREIFDFEPGAPLDRATFSRRVHPEDRAAREAAIEHAIKSCGEYELEYRIVLEDGAIRWMSGRGRCVADEKGGPARLLGVSMDITRAKQTGMEAQVLREELAHLSRVATLSALTSTLAHELSQPLASILANAQAGRRFLAQDPPELGELRDILGDIASDCRRAGGVIGGLRAMLRPGGVELQPVRVDETLAELLRLMHSDLIGRGVSVSSQLAADLPPAMTDRVQLQQVLLNLIVNACDAMAETPPAGRKLTLTTAVVGEEVRIGVLDCGVGLPDDVERLFEPFQTTKAGGLGMGLSICRTLITAHGGRLWAERRPEGGAAFHLALPLARAAE